MNQATSTEPPPPIGHNGAPPDAPGHPPYLSALLAALMPLVGQMAMHLEARQIAVLLAIENPKANNSVASLASLFGFHKSGVSRAINRLEKLGFATRKMNKLDGRSPLIVLTKRGQAFLANMEANMAGNAPIRSNPPPPISLKHVRAARKKPQPA